uniref:Si:zfos-2372e4.1 n=1 Tax=Astyanax mexicanus TaxID=7994 RepID=A0A3B1K9P3_ASTMX
MPFLLSLVQVILLSVLFIQYTTAFPAVGDVEDDDSLIRMDSHSHRRCLFPRDSLDEEGLAVEDRRSELQIRQLGDLEFTNRYAELLKSKAKLSHLCSFLRRMQNSKK